MGNAKVSFSPRSFPQLATEPEEADTFFIPEIGTMQTVGNLSLPVRSYLKNPETQEVRILLGVSNLAAQNQLNEASKQGRLALATMLQEAGFKGEYVSDQDDRVKFDETAEPQNTSWDEVEDDEDDDFEDDFVDDEE